MGGKHEEIRVDTTTGLQFRRLSVRPSDRLSPANSGKVASFTGETTFCQGQEILHSQAVHVSDRSSHSNREAGVLSSSSHETHRVASEMTLAHTEG